MGHFLSRGNNHGNNFDPLNDNVRRLRQRNLNDHDSINNGNSAHSGARSFYVIFGKPSIRYRRERTRGPLIFNVRRNVHINEMDEVVDESSLGAVDAIQHARSLELACAISNKQHFELVYSPKPPIINVNGDNNNKDTENMSNLEDDFMLHFQLSLNEPLQRLTVCANVAVLYEKGKGIYLQGNWRKAKHATNNHKRNNYDKDDATVQPRSLQFQSNSKSRPLLKNSQPCTVERRRSRKMYCLYDAYHITEDEVNVQVPAKVLANTSEATFNPTQPRTMNENIIIRSSHHHSNSSDDDDYEFSGSRRSSESFHGNGTAQFENHHSSYYNNLHDNIDITLRHNSSSDSSSDDTQNNNHITLTQKRRIASAPFVIISYIHMNGPKPKIVKKVPKVKPKTERTTSQIRIGTSVEERKDIFCLKIKSTTREEVKTTEHSEANENEGISVSQKKQEEMEYELEEEEAIVENEEKENQILFTFLDFNPQEVKYNLSHNRNEHRHDHHHHARELSSHSTHTREGNTHHVINMFNERFRPNHSSHSHMSSSNNNNNNTSSNSNSLMEPQRSTLSSSSKRSVNRKIKLNVASQLLQIGTEVYILEDVFDLGVTEKNEDNENGEGERSNDNNYTNDNTTERENSNDNNNKKKESNDANYNHRHNNHTSIFDVDQDDNEDHDVCVICLSNPNNTTLLPCRHKCVCHACAAQLKLTNNRCPICRAKIERTMTL